MALKDIWIDKVNDEDYVDADDINRIAQAVIDLEESSMEDPSKTLELVDTTTGLTYVLGVDGGKLYIEEAI